jgi:DNA primase
MQLQGKKMNHPDNCHLRDHMKFTESQYINAGFILARAKGWRFDRARERIEFMIARRPIKTSRRLED